jgi:hypothetical protein
MGGPKISTPAAPPPVPTAVNPAVQQAATNFRADQAQAMGARSTILTSGLGALGLPATAPKRLLGQ